MAGQTAVSILNLSRVYRQGEINVTALNNVSLDIAEGEFLTLIGPVRLWQIHLLRHHRRHRPAPPAGSVRSEHRCREA